jgi:hypothetical protein
MRGLGDNWRWQITHDRSSVRGLLHGQRDQEFEATSSSPSVLCTFFR